MSLQNHGSEILAAAAKSAPPLAVSGGVVAGMTLNEWVLLATLVYTVLQTFLLVRKLIGEWRNRGRKPQ